ncbi:hypothetical protein [uncultured Tateyamaria sp.]|uniref:hypothetical protein n=1 Tax=uncultured Tateyamaria sp. TaxID=455651 RepID=UPI0026125A49|nr:hypothetical protein [uncultured Tateyamaria sp.]
MLAFFARRASDTVSAFQDFSNSIKDGRFELRACREDKSSWRQSNYSNHRHFLPKLAVSLLCPFNEKEAPRRNLWQKSSRQQ